MIITDLQHTEPSPGLHRRDGRDFSMRFVKFNQAVDVDVGDTVSIGHHKGFVTNIIPDTLNAATRSRMKAGIHKGHFPGLRMIGMDGHLVFGGEIKRDI